MLLTLSARSFDSQMSGPKAKLRLLDLPRIAREELGLHGLTVTTTQLAGWDGAKVEGLRDRGDKVGCPCLVLIEPEPQRLADLNDTFAEGAEDRMARVIQAAHKLGCSSVAMSVHDPGPDVSPEDLSAALKRIVTKAERMELNLLLAPAAGITGTPEKLTGFIRKVGGFRIGAFPDFEAAAAAGDPTPYLKTLTPYAAVVCASFLAFDASGKHKGYDLDKCVQAVAGVGFDQNLTLEYRGTGDPMAAITRARQTVEALVSAEEPTDDDPDE